MAQFCHDFGIEYDSSESSQDELATPNAIKRAAAMPATDVARLLQKLQELILAGRVQPSCTGSGRVTLSYFDERAAARRGEPFRVFVVPNFQLPAADEPCWPNN